MRRRWLLPLARGALSRDRAAAYGGSRIITNRSGSGVNAPRGLLTNIESIQRAPAAALSRTAGSSATAVPGHRRRLFQVSRTSTSTPASRVLRNPSGCG